MSNLCRHVKNCWGEDTFDAITKAKDIATAQKAVKKYSENGTVTMVFTQKKKGKTTYST